MNIATICRQFLVLALFTASSTLFAQTVYSWKDGNGVLSYGHTPPLGVQATVVSNSSSSYQPEPGEAKTYSIADSVREKKDTPTKEDKKYLDKEGLKNLCDNARKNLATIERSGIIRSKDKDGNIKVLTADEKQQRKVKNQKIIDENC